MKGRFKQINFSRVDKGSKVKTKMVCIYDSQKVSRETAWKYCKQNSSSRNLFIVTKNRYHGVLKEMVDALNREGGIEDEDSC